MPDLVEERHADLLDELLAAERRRDEVGLGVELGGARQLAARLIDFAQALENACPVKSRKSARGVERRRRAERRLGLRPLGSMESEQAAGEGDERVPGRQ